MQDGMKQTYFRHRSLFSRKTWETSKRQHRRKLWMTEPDTVFSYNIKNPINEDQFEEQDFTKIKSFNYEKSVVYKKNIIHRLGENICRTHVQ